MKRDGENKSIILYIIRFIVVFILLLVFLLAAIWGNTRNVLKVNTLEAMKSALVLYQKHFQDILNNTDKTINMVINDLDDITTLTSDDESVRYFTSIRIKNRLDESWINNNNLSFVTVFGKKYQNYLAYENGLIDIYNKQEFRKTIREIAYDNKKEIYKWQIRRIGDYFYLLRVLENVDTVICAAVGVDLILPLKSITDSDNRFTYTMLYDDNKIDSIGKYSGMLESGYSQIVITEPIPDSRLALSIAIDKVDLYGKLQLIQIGIFILVVMVLGFLLIFARYLNIQLFHPLKDLIEAMKQIEQGKYEYEITEKPDNAEMKKVIESFNSMVKEILLLKIQAYEETIQLQASELRYLQAQIKPHFLLNALSTIHSMSFKSQEKDIRTYIEVLSSHTRYILNMKYQLVPLSSELMHIKNYFSMQDILYPNCVLYYIDVEKEALEVRVPPLLMHTIIENTYKYAVSVDKLLSIYITGKIESEFDGSFLHLMIEDDGIGFPEADLDKINNPDQESKSDGSGIGLKNLHATMQTFFNRKDLLSFSNRGNIGAVVDIKVPV